MLKRNTSWGRNSKPAQPPSGGCVLKLNEPATLGRKKDPAAFRRLCVETVHMVIKKPFISPAAFRRLCVETRNTETLKDSVLPAAFRRLCVETIKKWLCPKLHNQPPSGGCVLKPGILGFAIVRRDPAAFRRLCVETH